VNTLHYNPRLQLQMGPKDVLPVAEFDLPTFPFHTVDYRRDMSWTRGANLLDELGLGAYTHARHAFHLIGFTARAVHPHDRWLFRTRVMNDRLKWVRVGGEVVAYSSLGEPVGNDLVDALEGLAADAEDAASALDFTAKDAPMRLLSQAAAISQGTLGFSDFDRLVRARMNLSLHPRHIHDMLYHYDEWARHNTVGADMPRELVLRMHGLGGLLTSGYRLPAPTTRLP
jgi:hypothetical protein